MGRGGGCLGRRNGGFIKLEVLGESGFVGVCLDWSRNGFANQLKSGMCCSCSDTPG